jgi:hypothetical protein
MTALVLAPAVGLAQDDSANGAGNTKDQPGLVDKVIGTITGRSPDTKKGASADANKSGDPAAKAAGTQAIQTTPIGHRSRPAGNQTIPEKSRPAVGGTPNGNFAGRPIWTPRPFARSRPSPVRA